MLETKETYVMSGKGRGLHPLRCVLWQDNLSLIGVQDNCFTPEAMYIGLTFDFWFNGIIASGKILLIGTNNNGKVKRVHIKLFMSVYNVVNFIDVKKWLCK